MTFNDLGLHDNLLKAIHELGFTEPTAIQSQSIPVLLQGNRDYIGLAQTGTGKTAAFGLPLIQNVDSARKELQALVICPTRELCLQISKELEKYSQYIKGLSVVPVYGGVSIEEQIRAIKRGAQIVVGTPGRLIDHIQRKSLSLHQVATVVLDEADEMFNMGFQEDIDTILKQTPSEKQIWLFSATMPYSVEKIAQVYMKDPFKVTVGARGSSAQNLVHQYCVVKAKDSYLALRRFVDYYPEMFGILFCRTRKEAKDIAEKLVKDGYSADALHGDLSQSQRDFVMKKFRSKKMQLLIATDVAARGIDVSDVTHVIHYNLPEDIEGYTHRSGRTARAGKSGISIAILNIREVRRVHAIEKHIGQKMVYVRIPNGTDICLNQLEHTVKTFTHVSVDKEQIKPFMDMMTKACADMSKEDLIATMIAKELNDYIQRYAQAPDLNADATAGGNDREEMQASDNRLFINVGAIDGLDKSSFAQFITERTSVPAQSIFQITLKPNFTFFSVENNQMAHDVIEGLKNKTLHGRKLRVEISADRPRGGRGGGSRGGYRSDRSNASRDRDYRSSKRPMKRRSDSKSYGSKR